MKTQQEVLAAYQTLFDHENPHRAEEQYQKGLRMAKECAVITIGINGVWSAVSHNQGIIASYEKLGYHANTAPLLKGWLDGGAHIVDRRAELGFLSCGNCGVYRSEHVCDGNMCPQCGHQMLPNIEGGK